MWGFFGDAKTSNFKWKLGKIIKLALEIKDGKDRLECYPDDDELVSLETYRKYIKQKTKDLEKLKKDLVTLYNRS